jgi:hypothetical protein
MEIPSNTLDTLPVLLERRHTDGLTGLANLLLAFVTYTALKLTAAFEAR